MGVAVSRKWGVVMKHRKREKVKQSKESKDWPLATTIIKLKF